MVSQKFGRKTVNFSGGYRAQWFGECLVGGAFVEYLLHLLRNPTNQAAPAAGGPAAPRKQPPSLVLGLSKSKRLLA